MIKVITLAVGTSHIQEIIHLFFCFYTLCYDLKSHKAGHTDNGFQDAVAFSRTLLVHLKKLHINFQHIHIYILEHI